MTLVSFFLVPLSNVEFTDSTVGTQPFSRSGSAKCRQRVESCSLKNPRSFRICGYIRTLSETIKSITLALFISLFSTPLFSTLFLSFLYAFSHVALSFTLSCIQLPSFRPYSHPRTLFRLSHSRFLPPFFLTPIRSPFLFPFSYRFFFYSGNDTDTLHYA